MPDHAFTQYFFFFLPVQANGLFSFPGVKNRSIFSSDMCPSFTLPVCWFILLILPFSLLCHPRTFSCVSLSLLIFLAIFFNGFISDNFVCFYRLLQINCAVLLLLPCTEVFYIVIVFCASVNE